MTEKIVLEMDEKVLRRFQTFARITGENLADVMTRTLETAIPEVPFSSESVDTLSDTDILALTELHMNPDDDRRHSELLNRQQAGLLSDAEHVELQQLVQIYRAGLLRKSQALQEAVQRRLREPLDL